MNTYVHTCTHTHTQISCVEYLPERAHSLIKHLDRTYIYTRIYIYIYIHTYIHTYIFTNIYIHVHTHTRKYHVSNTCLSVRTASSNASTVCSIISISLSFSYSSCTFRTCASTFSTSDISYPSGNLTAAPTPPTPPRLPPTPAPPLFEDAPVGTEVIVPLPLPPTLLPVESSKNKWSFLEILKNPDFAWGKISSYQCWNVI